MENRHIIIFDGLCNLCQASVKFIIQRDPDCQFVFTPMQSDVGKALASQYDIDNIELDTIILIKQGQSYIWSDAALEICKSLNGLWPFLSVFKAVPRPLRDPIYRFIARNRYKLFGKRDVCMVPTDDLKSRFITTD